MFKTLYEFYRSKEWKALCDRLMLERVNEKGEVICEHCGKPIVNAYDCIRHHKIPLTEANVNDFTISLNEDNIALVHHKCHNEIHQRFGTYTRHIYVVYGAPCSNKELFVKSSATKDDLIVDIDKIYQAISINDLYIKSKKLTSNTFQIRDLLLDMVKTRNGKWNNAWIIGGYPLRMDRERLADSLGAELIYIKSNEGACLERALKIGGDYTKYVTEWFDRYQP